MNQRVNESAAIAATIQLYIDGVKLGDTELLRRAFHPKAMMYGASGDNIVAVEIDGLYAFVEANDSPTKTGEPHKSFITHIHYAGHAASVEMLEESSYGHDYVNYFHLLKVEGKWLIVSKSYNATVKG
jgi:hypothetical protein